MDEIDYLQADWVESSEGNPTVIIGKLRITVFESDGGWKFCVAKNTSRGDGDPHFSYPYERCDEAMHESFAHLGLSSTKYLSMWDKRKKERQRERENDYNQLMDEAISFVKKLQPLPRMLEHPRITIGKLQPVERKLARYERSLDFAKTFFEEVGSDETMRIADEAKASVVNFLDMVKRKIADIRATRAAKNKISR